MFIVEHAWASDCRQYKSISSGSQALEKMGIDRSIAEGERPSNLEELWRTAVISLKFVEKSKAHGGTAVRFFIGVGSGGETAV